MSITIGKKEVDIKKPTLQEALPLTLIQTFSTCRREGNK
jgi:hypothetical protein